MGDLQIRGDSVHWTLCDCENGVGIGIWELFAFHRCFLVISLPARGDTHKMECWSSVQEYTNPQKTIAHQDDNPKSHVYNGHQSPSVLKCVIVSSQIDQTQKKNFDEITCI